MAQSPQFLRLPDELLVEVIQQVTTRERERFKATRSLSLVCRRMRPTAFGLMLARPTFHLRHTRRLLETYLEHPAALNKVRTVEIVTMGPGYPDDVPYDYYDAKYRPQYNHDDKKFELECLRIVDGLDCSTLYKQLWKDHLQNYNGSCQPFLVLLLGILPNLEDLLIGSNHVSHIKLIDALRPPAFDSPKFNYMFYTFEILAANIRTLELPLIWKFDKNRRPRVYQAQLAVRLEDFRNLRTLTIPFAAIDTSDFLPASLEHLRIADAKDSGWFYYILLDWIKRKSDIKPTIPTSDSLRFITSGAMPDKTISRV
ncbi:hypothetical protein BDV96DRAFT_651150 [Lophiotrema nucula]|uniref:F-box domain-containing protein n=1 Tax=Lophiotrema nucula TaxID=690887 RepID=A0A6A5YU29_9PLEO|nr:hypothetical protein BDV96DRAFT_651150 [Lophiotrema nucula]